MTNPTLERAARAAADADAKLSNGPSLYASNPDIYQKIARAVLVAVRDCPNLPGVISVNGGRITANECMSEFIQAILNDDEEE